MSKIGIMTFHNANNYGAALQAYALQTTVSRLFPDHRVEVIDYQSKAIRDQRSFKAMRRNQGIVKAMIHYPFLKHRIKNIDRFVAARMQLSDKVESRKQLGKVASDYAAIISGSDQVWNRKLTGGEDTYLQDFHQGKARKLSYAASLGVSEIPKEWKDDYKKYLMQFDAVSVREDAARMLLKKEFDIDAAVHIDPTLLLDAADWHKIAGQNKQKHKYVLVYMVPFQKAVLEYGKAMAKKHGAKLVVVCRSLKAGGGTYKGLSPVDEILALFQNAQYVVTNSFHGTAFSVINQRKFVLFLNNPVGYNIRAKQLLLSCGILKDEKTGDRVDCLQCDWDQVSKNLELKKKEAKDYLRRVVGSGIE